MSKLTQLSSTGGGGGSRVGEVGGVVLWHAHAKTSSSLSVHLVDNNAASSGLLSESPPDNEAAEVELWFGRRIKLEAKDGADIFRQ